MTKTKEQGQSLLNFEGIKKIRLIEIITTIFDALYIIFIATFMIIFFLAVITPTEKNPPLGTSDHIVRIFGTWWAEGSLNILISVLIIILVLAVPMYVTYLKKIIKKDRYDYNKWDMFNTFVHGVVNIVTLNIIGGVLKFVIGSMTLKYSEGVGTFGFITRYFKNRKENKIINKPKNDEIKARKLRHKEEIKNQKQLIRLEKEEIKKATSGNLAVDKTKLAKLEKGLREFQKYEYKHDDIDEEILMTIRLRKQATWGVVRKLFTYIFLGIVALFIFIPFYWMVLTALRPYSDIVAAKTNFFPAFSNWQWVNIKYVFLGKGMGKYIYNTLIVGITTTIGTVITTVLAAFAFGRLDFKGRDAMFSILLATMMIPGELFIITNFTTVGASGFNWLSGNSFYLAMIIPFMTSVFYTFYLRQAFMSIPDSLYQAAKVDGSSDFKYLMRVMIPIASPTIITIIILSVIGSWNAYVWPHQITRVNPLEGPNYYLVSVALRELSFSPPEGFQHQMTNLQLAASSIVTIPLLIVFLVFRDKIMKGVGRSGTKG